MIKYGIAVLLTLSICGACLSADVPVKEYAKDAHTLFLCHFNSADEVKSLGGTVSDSVKFVAGKFGNGAQFEVKGDRITFPTKGTINPAQGTIEMFIKPIITLNDLKHPDDPHPYFLHIFNNNNNWTGLLYNVNNKTVVATITAEDANGGKRSAYSQAAIKWKQGEWHHVAFTWGNGAITLYIDGKLAATSKYAGGIGVMPDKFSIGTVAWQGGPAHAVIDEMRVLDIPMDFNKAEDW